jgi:hypothetical protein
VSTTQRIMQHNRHAAALVYATVIGDDAEAKRLLDDPSADPGVDALLNDIIRDAQRLKESQNRTSPRSINRESTRPSVLRYAARVCLRERRP